MLSVHDLTSGNSRI